LRIVTRDACDIRLTSQTGIALILAPHKLSTNSVKYVDSLNHIGNISVSWDTVACESGGADATLA
jgi:hypothetical protein